MDVIEVASHMEKLMQQMAAGAGQRLRDAAERKAAAIAAYDKALAIKLIRLKAGEIFELDGQTIGNPPVSIMDKLAKGLCWQECLEKEKAEAFYKNAVIWQETTCAQLNGWQSIFRHLEAV